MLAQRRRLGRVEARAIGDVAFRDRGEGGIGDFAVNIGCDRGRDWSGFGKTRRRWAQGECGQGEGQSVAKFQSELPKLSYRTG